MKEDKKKPKKEGSELSWFIKVFITTFILSIVFSYISTNGVTNLKLVPAIFVLFIVIMIGVIFDIIGVAVTVAKEQEFHAKATKKIEGSKNSIKLIRNSAKVANICADVIGDICGVLSGSIGALVAMKMTQSLGTNFGFIVSALVASITVGGKAIGKGIAQKNSTKIVHFVGIVLNKFGNKENKKNVKEKTLKEDEKENKVEV